MLLPEGVREGPAAELLADPDLLDRAGLRLPWPTAVAALLRTRGLLAPGAPGQRTPEELAAWAVDA